MPKKIIDNKAVEMTEEEFVFYKDICRSYDRPNFKGEDLFVDLFESDDDGIIMFLKPPSTRHTSMEVFLFVSILMQHQHIRLMHSKVDKLCADIKRRADIAIEEIKCQKPENKS